MQIVPSDYASYAAEPTPRQLGKHSMHRAGILLLLLLCAFVAVSLMFRRDAALTDVTEGELVGMGLRVSLDPTGMSATSGDMPVHVRVNPESVPGLFDRDGLLLRDLVVTLEGGSESVALVYKAGQPLGVRNTTLSLSGSDVLYPWDTWEDTAWASAQEQWVNEAGQAKTANLPVRIDVESALPNWDIRFENFNFGNTYRKQAETHIVLKRDLATKTIAIMMLGCMVLLSVLAIWMANLVFTNRRIAEIGMFTWLAGLLFALPSLRRSMPDAPEIGVAIDMYLFLWTLVGSAASAALVMVAWWSQSRARILHERGGAPQPPTGPEPAASASWDSAEEATD